jgi:eukaryotic-like serine/threonine-protein kinase
VRQPVGFSVELSARSVEKMSLEGQWLDGKYVIVRRIAEGGMSTVYLGVNQRIGKDVAVKVLHPDLARNPDILERFEREARIVSRIRSEHVADVFDVGELPTGARFMVMEYLEGESLATILERERTIPSRRLATIAAQILDALAAAHRAGVIHRDLKPENVIVTTRGKEIIVKVVDFGISKVVEEPDKRSYASASGERSYASASSSERSYASASSSERVRITVAGLVLGTPLYMSPEQARGQTSLIDHRTDLYSLGVMLYEATAGEPPITGENLNDLLFRVARDEPEPLTKRVPSVDPALAAIVRRAMAKDPADRYASADEMLEAVEAWRDVVASGAVPSVHIEEAPLGALPAPPRLGPAPTPDGPLTLTLLDELETANAESRWSRQARRVVLTVPVLGLLLFIAVPTLRHERIPMLARAPVQARVAAQASVPAAMATTPTAPAAPTASLAPIENPPIAPAPSAPAVAHVNAPPPASLPVPSARPSRRFKPAPWPHGTRAPAKAETKASSSLAPLPGTLQPEPSTLQPEPSTLQPEPIEQAPLASAPRTTEPSTEPAPSLQE